MYINETVQKHRIYKYTYYQNTHIIVKNTHTLQNPHIHTSTPTKHIHTYNHTLQNPHIDTLAYYQTC